jgi:hypothetical protein
MDMPEAMDAVSTVEQFDGLGGQSAPDDAAGVLREREVPERAASTIGELLDEASGADEAGARGGKQADAEPGWIKKRVESAVQKQIGRAVDDAVARISRQYEERMAPLLEQVHRQEARQLVADGEFKSEERALEYVRLKSGRGGEAAPEPPARDAARNRDAQGRFVAGNGANADARARELYSQADALQRATGLDVMGAFRGDESIRRRVLSGEWDFADVARAMSGKSGGRGAPPAPARSPNEGRMRASSISGLSDAQFDKLDEALRNGKVFDLRE